MTTTERIGYVLIPVLCILASVVLVGAIILPMFMQQFGHSLGIQIVITIMSPIAALWAIAMTLILQVQFLQHKITPNNQTRWWHLYFGSAAALAGFILAFMICVSDYVSLVELCFLTAASVSACMLAKYEDSGTAFDVATRHSYGMLFGVIFVAPTLLVGFIFPFGGLS